LQNFVPGLLVTDESPEFLAIQLNGPCIQEQILEVKGVGAGVPKLALHRIEDLICLWPKKIEQEAIVQRFYRYETGIREQVRSLNRLHSLKSALMQDLLTGKKRVTALLEGQDAADATL
jgi:type I restriction enzyme S subunit